MPIPVLNYPLTTQNSRVTSLTGNQRVNSESLTRSAASGGDGIGCNVELVIERSYRQIFFHAMSCDREPFLESQLRNGSITVRDFIRGLLLSERFLQGYYQCSSNYRMVDQVVGRVLGRPAHGDEERRSWSIVIGELGYKAFIDQILNSDEYMHAFGLDLVPEQRSRVLPGKESGDVPIYQSFPRYGQDWRDSLQLRAPSDANANSRYYSTSSYTKPRKKLWTGITFLAFAVYFGLVLKVASSMAH